MNTALLQRLVAGPTLFIGQGVNHEGEFFAGELGVQPLEDGRAALLVYTARLADGTVVHTESALLAADAGQRLCLWPVMSELPGVLPHVDTGPPPGPPEGPGAVFATGPLDDETVFREAITLRFTADGALVYAHAWGLPGGPFDDRSSCTLHPSRV